MAKLSARKSRLQFETEDVIRERGKWRNVMIEATPHIALVRLKGQRKAFPISYGAIYHRAAALAADAARREKQAAKKQKRRAR